MSGRLRGLASRLPRWTRERRLLLEVFVLSNPAFLTIDVYVAHAVNDFHDPLEWIPVVFAAVGSAVLIAAFVRRAATARRGPAGLGLLLLVNRMVDPESPEWGRWVVFLALGGFVGNFALSLADHAQNGFFFAREWISVVASAFAVGFLALAVFGPTHRRFLAWCQGVMAVQVAVGLLGFWYHLATRFRGGAAGDAGEGWAYELIFGAPVFAPLLFSNLALLAALGLWDLAAKAEAERASEVRATAA